MDKTGQNLTNTVTVTDTNTYTNKHIDYVPDRPPEKEGFDLACVKKLNPITGQYENQWEYFPQPEGFVF